MTRNGARLAALLAGLLVAITLGMSAANAQTTVNVELNEWNIIPNVSSVAAGDVEFVATNTGAIEHELVVLKTELAADALPVAGGRVDEHGGAGIEAIGEIESFAAGATERATLALTAGSYVLICNIAGHYQSGMHVGFTVSGTAVTAPAASATAPAPQVPRTGSGGASAAGDGLPTVALIVALTALGGAILAAGGGWAVLRSRRPTR
jgi:uncharacterized cupredoxin-like copper-binding protein